LPEKSSILSKFTAPVSRWNPVSRRTALLCAVVLTGAYAIVVGMRLGNSFTISDSGWYQVLAVGDPPHMVVQPFASRQLGPAVVRLFSWLLHWPVRKTFVVQGVISLAVTLVTIFTLALRTTMPRWMLLALAAVPFWPQLYLGLALPDLWYAGLLSVFLLLLWRKHFLTAALMMFPLMVSRESTSLTLVCFLIVGWRELRWRGRLLAVGSTLAGTLLVQRLTIHSPGNREHLPELIYILSKAPWNFVRNFLGVEPWTNIFPLCKVPEWQHSVHVGPLHAVGICKLSILLPMLTVNAALSTFGLLPLLAIFLWWRTRHVKGRSLLERFSLLYGAVCLAIAPLIGVWMPHLFGYGWPFSLVALPKLFDDIRTLMPDALNSKRAAAAAGFLALHLAASGFGLLAATTGHGACLIVLYLAGYLLLRRWFGPSIPVGDKRLHSNPEQAPARA
jgi:hypothetical protein